MKCPRCQAENREGARFCRECGATFGAVCSRCGAKVEAGSKFCDGCGAPLATTPAPGPGASRFASPESYTPKHLAEKILTSKAALEGERKQVTVLFADLKGSMELMADRDPEEARKILDPVLERMMGAVHRYEGTVNQVMGDGIMALFGAPLAHEDHAVRACYAALRMQENVKEYAEQVRRSHAAVVKIRVGLNSGEVVVRAIGSDLHMDYTAVGQTTHLAARMEQIADPGAIVITPETLVLAEGYVEVKPLGPVPVKGLAAAVEVYEVTGAGSVRTRLQAAARRGLTRFVGRDAELEQLRRAQQLAGDGHGQVAAIIGEAGVGKSRLVYELTHSHRLQGWLVLESASVSYGKATSYLPVIDLLKDYFKIQGRDDLREIREKVTGKLLTLDRALEPTLPALLALLDVPVDDVSWRTLDPAQRRQQTLDAIKRLLLREAREQPLLVIFEDLHWIDGETQALLDGLVESLGSARLLLLVNYRPEYQHAWGSKTSYGQIRLDALPAESSGELLEALLGADPELAPLKQLLVRRGNPFFLEETVRTLVETKALAGERGRYRLTQPVQAIQVPPTVQVMLAARIDRLAPEDKRMLQVASVVGKDVPFALLQAIAELPDEALRGGLDHLQAAEFLYETGLYPDLEYAFKHALTHEVTYSGLLQERRRELHARIVGAIETLHQDRLGEHIERLAHHAVRAERWNEAADYLRLAGARATARGANREAITHFELALSMLTHLPSSRATIERAIDLRFDLRNSLHPLGELARILEYLREAEVLADELGDQRRLGLVANYMANYRYWHGDPQGTVAAARRVLTVADALDDFGLRVVGNFRLGLGCHSGGDYAGAIEAVRWNVEALQGELAHQPFGLGGLPSVLSRCFLTWALAERGAFAEAHARSEEAIGIADATGQPFSMILAHFGSGMACLRQGRLDRATLALAQALSLSRTRDVPLFLSWAAAALGFALALQSRVDEGIALLEEAERHAQAITTPVYQPLRLAWLAEARRLAGQPQEAEDLARRALDSARDLKERGHEAWGWWHLAEIVANSGPSSNETAKEHYDRATRIATELGMRPVVAHCHLGLGKLYRRTGKHQQAQEPLTTATTMYRDMDMRFWWEQAEAEMRA